MKAEIIAFTAQGARLAACLCGELPEAEAWAPPCYCTGPVQPLRESLAVWTARRFRQGTALVFIGAAGIAVRAIAPHVRGKEVDPAVICIDHAGRYVIPLLSGHLGGANRLAQHLAVRLGAQAVLTTGTDVSGVFSPDAWAEQHGCSVADVSQIKYISAALLRGERVGFVSEFPVKTALPDGVYAGVATRCGIEVAVRPRAHFQHTLLLIPRCIVAGIGCRRGVDVHTIRRRLVEVLREAHLPLEAVGAVASIDIKADEPGLLGLCERLNAPLLTFPAQQLMAVKGEFSSSKRVERVTGADNVCERAAVLAGGRLIVRKSAANGVTVALAQREFTVSFEGATS